MSSAIHMRTTILPGGRVQFESPELQPGETVDVFVVVGDADTDGMSAASHHRPSALEILDQAPGHQLFKTAEEVDAHLREERNAWD